MRTRVNQSGIYDFGLRVLAPSNLSPILPSMGFRVQGLAFGIKGSGCRAHGSAFRVQSLGRRDIQARV